MPENPRYLIFVGALLIAACTSPSAPAPDKLKTFSTDHMFAGQAAPLCKAMLDTYCNFLFSPGVLGNLNVGQTNGSTTVLQGDTNNQFSQVYYRYSLAKVRNRSFLPRDFARVLDRQAYFTKLKVFLERAPRSEMALNQRLMSEQTDFELGFIWSAALNETVLVRMDRKFPDYHKLPDNLVPVELQLERRRVRRELVSEVSRAIWRQNAEWKNVEAEFVKLQKSFLHVIGRLDVPEATKLDWIKRISEVRLVLPGAFPAISDEECSATNVNAFYYTHLNVVTICAGDFNSEDITQTLSHEMAHALGVDRTQYLFQQRSDFGRRLGEIRRDVCAPQRFTCEHWRAFKAEFDHALLSLDGFTPQVEAFQSCLKRRPTTRRLTGADAARFAQTIVSDRISDLASSDRFLRITKASMPLRNGREQKNPNYLNPCGYYLWTQGEEPIEDELSTLMYFTAEYRCGDAPSATDKLKNAIEVAKQMSTKVLERTLKIEGEFSARGLLETEGFASAPFERFADVIGSYAMADLLAHSPSVGDRQNRFLASTSWQCLEPSLAAQYPAESSVEKEYIFDPHTEGDLRRKELFSGPIREVIGCQKDFEFHECKLDFLDENTAAEKEDRASLPVGRAQ